eukprot:1185700-Prorocentrum_minimum.AAC.2
MVIIKILPARNPRGWGLRPPKRVPHSPPSLCRAAPPPPPGRRPPPWRTDWPAPGGWGLLPLHLLLGLDPAAADARVQHLEPGGGGGETEEAGQGTPQHLVPQPDDLRRQRG